MKTAAELVSPLLQASSFFDDRSAELKLDDIGAAIDKLLTSAKDATDANPYAAIGNYHFVTGGTGTSVQHEDKDRAGLRNELLLSLFRIGGNISLTIKYMWKV